MQNYCYRCDWLTQAYPFKCIGAYESQILVDFTDNPDTRASCHARLYLSLRNCATTGQKPRGGVDEISWKSNTELVTLLYWDTWERWCVPPSALHSSPPLVSSYSLSVRERPPRCLISYIIRETAGRGCRQLTRGCRGRISCDFLEGLGFGIYSDLMSHVLGSLMIPQSNESCSLTQPVWVHVGKRIKTFLRTSQTSSSMCSASHYLSTVQLSIPSYPMMLTFGQKQHF